MQSFNIVFITLMLLNILIFSSASYRTLSVEDEDLCSPIKKRKVKLGRAYKSGLIVKQTQLSDHSLDWDRNFLCKFEVDASQHTDGIFAVIQNIVLRENETTGECIDFIQFKKHDGSTSRKHCGRLNAALSMDHNFASDIYSNAFVDSSGEMDVYIFIAKEALKVDEETDLNIVFTAYRRCSHATEVDKPCSEEFRNECIFYKYFNDGFVNCPYPDCVDENGCSHEYIPEKKHSIGNRVIIGSVTSLLVVFGFFVCCLLICRKYRKLCWSGEFSQPSSGMQQPPTTRVMEMSDQSSSRQSVNQNPINNVQSSSAPREEDKDLPPSYDSLFPER